jgi:protein-export membrane protein secD
MFTAITLTQYLLKLMVNAKISENPAMYGANGFMLAVKKGDEKNA